MVSCSLTSALVLWLLVSSSSPNATRAARLTRSGNGGGSSSSAIASCDCRHCGTPRSAVLNNETTTAPVKESRSSLPSLPGLFSFRLSQGPQHNVSQDLNSSFTASLTQASYAVDSFRHDLASLVASSSPGDLLDDAEMDELINAEGMWAVDTRAKDLKAYSRRIASDGLISPGMYRRFSSVIVYVAFPLIIVGFVTNVIAMKVFRQLPHNVTNTYMVCLILFDMAYLLFVVSSHIVVIIIRAAWARSSARHFLQLYVIYKFFILSARQMIIMATSFMSLDRYLVIAWPFRVNNVFLFRRPRLLILLAALLILTFNSHKLLKREIRSWQSPDTNNTVFYLAYTTLYRDNHGLLDDLTIASSCLFQYCPLFSMLVANVALMTSLRKYSRRASLAEGTGGTLMGSPHDGPNGEPPFSQTGDDVTITHSECAAVSSASNSSTAKGSKADKQFFHLEVHLCVTVVAYSLLFFLLALPLALLPILKKVFPEFNVFKTQHYFFLIYVRVFPLLDIISVSMNFFVFFIKGGAFRSGVYRILGCRRHARNRGTWRAAEGEIKDGAEGQAVGQLARSPSSENKECIGLLEK